MKPSRRLLVRADASPEIGVGHVMRCLALAQAWQDGGGEADFAAAVLPDSLAGRLLRERMGRHVIQAPIGSDEDAHETVRLARACGADWLAVDGYHFGSAYLENLQAAGLKLLALDDLARLDRYPVDLLLNQNLSASREAYVGRIDPTVELLLGPQFGLLRREFRLAAGKPRAATHTPRRVLVTFGGGDAENHTGRILENLIGSGRRDLEIVALAGAANPHVATLRRLAAAAPFRCEIRFNVEEVAAIMTWADVAIAAAGSTVWELMSVGLPALLGACEDNQLAGLAALQALACFRAWPVEELLGRSLAVELDALLATDPAPPAGCDAAGALRVVRRLEAADARPRSLLSVS